MNNQKDMLSPVWFHITDMVVTRGEGAYVWDDKGQRYTDFTSGIGVTNTGHCHPRVVNAIQQQAAKFIHAQVNIYYHDQLFEVAEALKTVVPDNLDTFFFSNSGAEAVEAAVKLARHATGKPNIVVFQGSFHGRTAQTMAMTTSKTVYRQHYQPLPGGVFVAPFPYGYRYGWTDQQASDWAMDELDLLFKSQVAPSETAAIVLETVIGEGGYIVPPPDFLGRLRAFCDAHDILLILDEIQSGFGRTGKFFALEHFSVQPDILIMAKGLGSGFPISAIAAPQAIMNKWMVGTHGGTYGGNAMGCAAAAETIRVIKEEKLVENAAERGQQLMDGLAEIQSRFPIIGDVRGLGLMVCVEFSQPGTNKPNADAAKKVLHYCLEDENLILMGCGSYGNVVRWIPPLIVDEEQIDTALKSFERCVGRAIK